MYEKIRQENNIHTLSAVSNTLFNCIYKGDNKMTREAELVQVQIDELRLQLDEESEEYEKKIKELKDKICEYCDGSGDVLAKHKITSRTISPPYETCPECNGSGVLE